MAMNKKQLYGEAVKVKAYALVNAIKQQDVRLEIGQISYAEIEIPQNSFSETLLFLKRGIDVPDVSNALYFDDDKTRYQAAFQAMQIIRNYEINWFTEIIEANLRFNDITLKEPDIVTMIKYFHELMKNPVIIYDEFFNVTAMSDDYLKEYERDEQALQRLELRNLFYYKQTVYLMDENAPVEKCNRLLFPVLVAGMPKGYLAIFDIDTPHDEMDKMILETFANSALVEMRRRLELGDVESKFISDFIYDVIYRKTDKQQEINRRAKVLGVEENADYIMIVINPLGKMKKLRFDTNGYITQYEFMNDRIMNNINNEQRKRYNQDIVTKFDNSIYILHKLNQHKNDEDYSNMRKICDHILCMLNELFAGMVFQIGVGDCVKGIKNISDSFNQAWDSISYGEMTHGARNSFIICYTDNSFLKLFSRLKETNSLDQFIPGELKTLLEYDKNNKTNFYNSLKAYLNCNCNGKKAADSLFIHYKTMLYRLDKLKIDFSIDLNNSTSRVYIELGMQFLEMRKNIYEDELTI